MLYALTALLSFVVFTSPVGADQKPPPRIEPRAVVRMLENRENIVLVNVASFLECMDSRIPASLCVACAEAEGRADLLTRDRNAKLVFYGGNAPVEESCEVIGAAQRAGFANLYILKGGLTAWKRAGYETESVNRIPRVLGPALKPVDLKAWLNTAPAALMIDLRSPAAYRSHHIAGAVNMPLASLHRTYQDLPLDRPLLVIDVDGSRSFLAASYLQRKGFENVRRLEGGMAAWQTGNKGGRHEGAQPSLRTRALFRPDCLSGHRGELVGGERSGSGRPRREDLAVVSPVTVAPFTRRDFNLPLTAGIPV